MNVQCIGDRVLVTTEPAEEKTPNGIFIPASAQSKVPVGIIEQIGTGVEESTLQVGMKVMFNLVGVQPIGEDKLLIRGSEIVCIVLED